MAAVGESGKKLLASYLEYHSRWEEEEKRRKGWMRWKRWMWKRREKGERESEAKLWLLRSMLYHVAVLPSSLKGPELRFGLPTRRWISAFVWGFFFFFFASFSPQTRLHTRCFQPSQGVLLFEVKAVGCFYRRFEFHFTFSLMAVILIVRLLSLKNLLPVTWGSPPPPCSAFHMTEWSFTVDPY